MPVALDTIHSEASTGVALGFNMTVAANAVMLAFVFNDNAQSVSAIAYNGAALTRLVRTNPGDLEVWGLTAPAAGTNAMNIAMAGASVPFGAIAMTYLNVKASNPFGTGVSATASTANVNLTVSSTSTDLVVAGFKVNFGGVTVNNGTTQASLTATNSVRLVVADITGAANTILSASSTGTPSWAMAGIPLQFSASAPAVTGITFDNTQTGSTNGTALAFNLTAAANSTLLVFYFNDNAQSASSIAYNSVQLTRLVRASPGDLEIWGLTSPAMGSNQLLINLAGAATPFGAIGLTYTNVKNVNPFGTGVSGTAGVVATAAFSISSTATDLVVGGFKINFSSFTGGNGTVRASATVTNSVRLQIVDINGASTVTLSAQTAGTPSWAFAGIPLVYSATVAGGAVSSFRMMMGIGR